MALKSKPFLLLIGQKGSGKLTFLSSLMRVLAGGNIFQCQRMKGHVWSTGYHGGATFLAEAQARMNSMKIQTLVEEANQPRQADKMFISPIG